MTQTDSYPQCKGGLIVVETASDIFNVHQTHANAGTDPIAVGYPEYRILLLADGEATLREIRKKISSDVKCENCDVGEITGQLQKQNLISIAAEPSDEIIINASIAFIDFWTSFDPVSSVITQFLARRFNLFITLSSIGPLSTDPVVPVDINFYSDYLQRTIPLPTADEQSSFSVRVPYNEQKIDLDVWSYAITAKVHDELDQNRALYIPAWQLFNPQKIGGADEIEAERDETQANSEQLEQMFDHFARVYIGDDYQALWEQPSVELVSDPQPLEPEITIGVRVTDNHELALSTLRSLAVYQQKYMQLLDIIVVDCSAAKDSPQNRLAQTVNELGNAVYLKAGWGKPSELLTIIAKNAETDKILAITENCLLGVDAIAEVISYLDTPGNEKKLIHGLRDTETHIQEAWPGAGFGKPAYDLKIANSTEKAIAIDLGNTNAIAFDRRYFPHIPASIEGEAGLQVFINQSYRLSGDGSVVLRDFRWTPARLNATANKLTEDDLITNILSAYQALSLDTFQLDGYFSHLLGSRYPPLRAMLNETTQNPFSFFDVIVCLCYKNTPEQIETAKAKFERFAVADKVKFIEAPAGTNVYMSGTLGHRSIIEEANRLGYSNCLIFESDFLTLPNLLDYLAPSIEELRQTEWQCYYLGGYTPPDISRRLQASPSNLAKVDFALTCPRATAYNSSVFEQLITQIPDNSKDVDVWAKSHAALDQYLNNANLSERYVLAPKAIAQEPLLSGEPENLRDKFI